MKQFKSPSIHRTPLYRAKAAYWGMLARCGNRNGKNPTYADVELRMTREEWLQWAVPEYNKFDQAHPNETPNAARIGDKGHYELGNIRIITQSVNCNEQAGRHLHHARPDGTKLCSKCGDRKSVGDFPKNRCRKDGYGYECKVCAKARRS